MKRSQSKTILAKAGSMRNINKQGYKFHVSLTLESIDKILSSSEVVFSWERNNKILQTKPTKVDKDTRTAKFTDAKLEQDVTFFKKKKAGSPFEEKVFRCLIKDTNTSKVIGKIDLNFSQHIDIPSNSKRMAAQLTNGSQIIMKFESKFLHEVEKKKKKKGKDDDSSSIVTDGDDLESEFDPKDDVSLADINDLEDLDISDDPPTNSSSVSSVSSGGGGLTASALASHQQRESSGAGSGAGNNVVKPPLRPSPSYDESPLQQPKYSRKLSNNVRPDLNTGVKPSARGRRSRDPSPGRLSNDISSSITTSTTTTSSGAATAAPTITMEDNTTTTASSNPLRFRKTSSKQAPVESEAQNGRVNEMKIELDTLRKDNRILKRRNEDLQSRVSDLEYKLADVTSAAATNGKSMAKRSFSDQATEIDDLYSENKSLKEHIGELEIQIKREPTYADVVKELRESKMALAIINLEKDELKQQLRKLQR